MHAVNIIISDFTEQIMVNTSNSSNIATISCGLNRTSSEALQFVLKGQNEDTRQVNLTCGGSGILFNFTGANYVLYRRYTEQLLCRMHDFMGDPITSFEGKLHTSYPIG